MNDMNFSGLAKILRKSQRQRLFMFSALRIVTNGLDLIGLAGIAVLASALGSFATANNVAPPLYLPVVGEIQINEYVAVVIAFIVTIVFVSKSGLSILLNLRTSLFVAKIETELSSTLASDYFKVSSQDQETKATVSDFQNMALVSTSGIKAFINYRILFYSEGTLLIGLLILFLAVNPIATIALTAFMDTVLFVLNKVINQKLKRAGRQAIEGSEITLQTVRDLHAVRREVLAYGVTDQWLSKFTEVRRQDPRNS